MHSISTKFVFFIGIVLFLLSSFLLYQTYFITKNHITEIVGEQASMSLEFDLAIRRYVSEKIRPSLNVYLPKEAFIPELMSTTYITRSIFEDVRKRFPEYQLKFASINPRNPLNLATATEAKFVDFFNKNPEIKDWRGEISQNGRTYLVLLHPDRAKSTCLRCHGAPADAPLALRDRYGLQASFNYSLNEVLGINTIAIPIDNINSQLWEKLYTLLGLGGISVFLLFIIIYFSFQHLVGRRLITIAAHLQESEGELPLYLSKGHDEISRLAESFNIMIARQKISYHELEEQILERTRINELLAKEITERTTAETSLKKMQEDLEKIVEERTDKLILTMVSLEKEILERKIAQDALQIERDKLTNLFNTIPDGVCIRNADRKIEFVNPVLEKEFGSGIGMKIPEYFVGIHLPNLAAAGQDRQTLTEEATIQWEWTSPVNAKTYDLVSTPLQNQEGTVSTLMILRDITSRKQTERKLKEHEQYLSTLLATIQTGVVVTDPETDEIVDVNPFAAKMIGASAKTLAGQRYHSFLQEKSALSSLDPSNYHVDRGQDDCILTTVSNEMIHVRRSFATVSSNNKAYFIQSLLDITDIKELLRQQTIDIHLARGILDLINAIPPRITDLNDSLALHATVFPMPSHAEGGDHVLIKNLGISRSNKRPRTIISVKDQSGHAVNCVMRSIVTDMLHNAIINAKKDELLETTITSLNSAVLQSTLFQADDFVTAITAELEHETLQLNYVSAGHPAFLLIRDDSVISLPDPGSVGVNLPLAVIAGISYAAGSITLKPGDRLVFFTDGLLDIALQHNNKSLTVEELKDIFQAFASEKPGMPISELILNVLAALGQESAETVIPFTTNTSIDDITIVGIEIEQQIYDYEATLHPSEETFDQLVADTYQTMQQALVAHNYTVADQGLHMVLSEAMVNAWKHGNNKDARKKIKVRWRFGNDFSVEVIDEGRGFNYERHKDPTAVHNLVRPSGRGLFIIRHFADWVRWKDGGRRIVITFKKHSFEREKEQLSHSQFLASLLRNINKA
ncbi:MAG: hypothetical protein A2511_14450 [Deltaproteobacteria bacterium RIFOXYD12_FULL_50_9]|nr:MAG: hypothetical protein A2511_14450 [Deltaproteobacteria bacterium RIFOXYD12_FULL_50_9]